MDGALLETANIVPKQHAAHAQRLETLNQDSQELGLTLRRENKHVSENIL